MRIGWISFHREGFEPLLSLIEYQENVVAVITLDKDLRVKKSGGIAYDDLCKKYDIPLYAVKNINSDTSEQLIKSLTLDLVFVIGWGQILKPHILRLARIGFIGAHASALPKNRGSAPVNWSIIHGERSTGNSLMWLSPEVDTGDILCQETFPIKVTDTCKDIYDKVARSNRSMINKSLALIKRGKIPKNPQESLDLPLLPRRKPSDGAINWEQSNWAIYNFIRALTNPYPGAFSYINNKKCLIWESSYIPNNALKSKDIGRVIGSVYSPVSQANGQLVQCGEGQIILLKVEIEHKIYNGYELSSQDWKDMYFSSIFDE